ncbi:MAG: TolC family protein [Deltaproteobacteria bacterium]
MLAPALALMIAAGCAADRGELQAIKNPGAEVQAVPLPPDIVRVPPAQVPVRPGSARNSSSDIILASAEEESGTSAQGSDERPENSGGQALEERVRVPKALPGADAPTLRPPKRTDENKAEHAAAMKKLYPELSKPPALDLGPSPAPRVTMTLDEFEQMALANSPVIAQYQADVAAQAGEAIQAGTHPNPLIGYEADTVGSAGTRNYQGVFFTQLIKTAGKLQVSQAIENVDLMNAQLALRQARIELLTQVRRQYFALLIARESVKINEAIVPFTHELYRVQVDQVSEGQAAAYEPPALRAFANQARAALAAARNRYTSAWQQMTATLNSPNMPVADLVDHPDMPVPVEDYDAAVTHVLSTNTEVRAARNGPLKARLVLRLAEITPIPDINAYLTLQRDFTTPALPRTTYNMQLGVPLPIFDRNKGNILAARASLVRATQEVTRVENDLRTRLADAFERFETSRVLVGYQRDHILPDVVRTYRGTYQRHIQEPDVVGFADVVVAQQNMLNAVSQYISALSDQWNAFADIAALLQVESLRELQLKLKEKGSNPEPVDGPDDGNDVTSLFSGIRGVPKTETPSGKGAVAPVEDAHEAESLELPSDE